MEVSENDYNIVCKKKSEEYPINNSYLYNIDVSYIDM